MVFLPSALMRGTRTALDMAANKTDANDADGLAHIAEVGFYREVRVKGFESMLMRTLVAARDQILKVIVQMSNQIRGLMKTFGLVVPKSAGGAFEGHVRRLLADNTQLERIVLPMLDAWRGLRMQAAKLDGQLRAASRLDQRCALLMSIPGIGPVTASSFVAAVEEPGNFKSSRAVGAWLGLTTRRYQSGEVDYGGHISRRGRSAPPRPALRGRCRDPDASTGESTLKQWGVGLRERLGFKRAAVAVARKLAVIMHRMLHTGELFDRTAGAAVS
ncbi:IS110 family transposase [Sphingomonas sp. Ant20]|uniref:IS110 family transposase n=1 Tax=Sphingomonas sp. Ant20 TaxID=104605 RepID=UPI000AC0B282|nr:IS110 family transposase [Sphingomonas sp. Ant20]